MEIIVVAAISATLGILLGGLSVKSQYLHKANTKLLEMSKLMSELITSTNTSNGAWAHALETQEKVVDSLIKEKKMIIRQLNKATEALNNLEEEMAGLSEDGAEDEDEDEDANASASVAENKLITIRKLLEDSAKKGEVVNPRNLLGIVNFKR